ncbi:MAG: hypothetical protein V4443_03705 [Pseudomonadota bacterium]
MTNFIQNLEDGWTIYLWLAAGGTIIISAMFWIKWGMQNEQFDEDIKYLVFDQGDKDKMSPEEFVKSNEVMNKQMADRVRVLKTQAEEKRIAAEKKMGK